jgi:hypothetical protein
MAFKNQKLKKIGTVSVQYPDKLGYRTAVLAYNRILITGGQRWRPFIFNIRSGYRIYSISGPDIGHSRNKDGRHFTILFFYSITGPDISHSRNKDGHHMVCIVWYPDRISVILGTKMATIFDIWTQICPDFGIFRLSGVRLSDADCILIIPDFKYPAFWWSLW